MCIVLNLLKLPVPDKLKSIDVDEREQVLLFINRNFSSLSFLLIALINNDVDYGNFIIWRNDERVSVRLDEHREHLASDPLLEYDVLLTCEFLNEDGSIFYVDYNKTVSNTHALEASYCWVNNSTKTENLTWS